MKVFTVLGAIITGIVVYELIVYLTKPEQQPDIYEEARRERIRKFGIRGDDL